MLFHDTLTGCLLEDDKTDTLKEQFKFVFINLLELELDSLAISFTTLDHRLKLFHTSQ